METKTELIEDLKGAGCSQEDIEQIVSCFSKGDIKGIEKAIRKNRRIQLDKIHESQLLIDRLDYLGFQMIRQKKGK